MNKEEQKVMLNPENSIIITANIPGDVSMNHMGASLATEYEKYGYKVAGILEHKLEVCGQFPYIVLNRLGLIPQPGNVIQQNMGLINSWVSDPDKLVTYYIDDLLFHMNNSMPIEFMKRCENVVVSNQVLKEYAEERCFIPEARIVKTHVNYDFIDNIKPAADHPFHDDRFMILWGSIGRVGLGFMDKLCALLDSDPRFKDITIFCIGMNVIKVRIKLLKYRNLNLHFAESMDLPRFYSMAKLADVIVNPVSTDAIEHFYKDPELQRLWLDAKCEPKFAMAGAMRKPMISGSMRAYTEAINDGQDGFLSDDPEEWRSILLELMDNSDLRAYIGNNARHRAETDYNYKTRTLEYIKAFTTRGEDEDE